MATLASRLVLYVFAFWFIPHATFQHCPPIVESYLSATSVKRNDEGLEFSVTYSKTGGRPKAAYQAYLVAFPTKNAATVTQLTPQQAIAKKHVAIIETKVIKIDRNREYQFKFQIETEDFVEKLLKEKLIARNRISNLGGWKSFDDQIQLAVFIPFLEDEKYSVLDELPGDSHECNYRGDSALLFEPFGPKLEVCYGVVQATKLKDGEHYIQLNGKRPAKG